MSVNFDTENLLYRGEGNKNLVLSNISEGLVYRFIKTKCNGKNVREQTRGSNDNSAFIDKLNNELIKDFIGILFYSKTEVLQVPEGFLLNINEKIKRERPDYRLDKSIDLNCRLVGVVNDAVLIPPSLKKFGSGPTLSVELKPKFGVIPQHPLTGSLEMAAQLNAAFCMLQYHEAKRSKWANISQYCPMDLFSFNREKMLKSLRALNQQPQTYMRVFLNGTKVFGDSENQLHSSLKSFLWSEAQHIFYKEKCALLDILNNLVIDGLLYEFPHGEFGDDDPFQTNENKYGPFLFKCDSFSKPWSQYCCLHNSCPFESKLFHVSDYLRTVLGRLLATQMLNHDTLESIQKCYRVMEDYMTKMHTNYKEILQKLLDGRQLVDCDDFTKECIGHVIKSQLSMTARDAQIILTMQRMAEAENCESDVPHLTVNLPDGSVSKFIFQISVIDLDSKNPHKISERISLRKDVLNQFLLHAPIN